MAGINDFKNPVQPTPQPGQPGPDWLESLGAGTAGALSGALFDLPEWLAKQIDRKGFETWKERNKDVYNAANLAGTIGSSFIPVAGLAGTALKLGSKVPGLAKLAGLGEKVASLGKATKEGENFGQMFGRLGTKAAVESGIGEGLRGFAHEKTAGETAQDIIGGAATGGLTGGLLGAGLGKLGQLAKEGQKATTLSKLDQMGFDTKSLRNAFKKSSGTGGAALKSQKVDEFLKDFKDVGDEYKLLGEVDKGEKIAQIRNDALKGYKPLDELAEKNKAGLFDKMEKEFLEDHQGMLAARPQMAEKAKSILDQLDKTSDLVSKRNILQDAIEKGANGNDPDLFRVAVSLKSSLDDGVNQLAKASGDEVLASLGKKWKVANTLGDAETRSDLTIQKGTGSPSYEKAAIAGMFGLGGAATGDWSDPNKIGENLAKTLAGSALGFGLSKGVMSAKNALLAGADEGLSKTLANPTAQKVISKAEELGAKGYGEIPAKALVAGLDNAKKSEIVERSPETLAQIGTQDQGAYRDLVQARLKSIWDMNYASQYPGEEAFQQFLAGAESASRGFDPERTANFIYPDPKDREAYLSAYRASKAVNQNADTASQKTGGFLGIGSGQTEEAKLAESALTSAATDSLKAAGIDAKTAKEAIANILKGGGNKKQKLLELLQRFNPQGFAALKGAGLS